MKKLFQSEWQGIPFSEFHTVSSRTLAGSDFYDAFYRRLFDKYSNYEALDVNWRRNKDELADWIADSLPDGQRVLSIGCGLGYMEQRLWRQHGERIELHVQDYASHALVWLKQILPEERIHDAGRGGNLGQFDLIYLSAVDYAMPDQALITLLADLRDLLREEGALLMISASFQEDTSTNSIRRGLKDAVKYILDLIKVRPLGQFWGWMRTRSEYQFIMQQAGFSVVTDGFLETPHQRTFWVKGGRRSG